MSRDELVAEVTEMLEKTLELQRLVCRLSSLDLITGPTPRHWIIVTRLGIEATTTDIGFFRGRGGP